jgi:hypothetical protein
MPRRRRDTRSGMAGVASSEYLVLAGVVVVLAIIVGRLWGPQISQATGQFVKKVGCTLAGEGIASCSPEALAAAQRAAAAPNAAGGTGTAPGTAAGGAGSPIPTAAGAGSAADAAKPGDAGAGSGSPPDNEARGQAGGNRAQRAGPAPSGESGGRSSVFSLTTLLVVLLVGLILLWVVARRRG